MGISLMVCNLAVTAAVILRLFKKEEGSARPGPSQLSSFALSKLRGTKNSRPHQTDTLDALTVTYNDLEGGAPKVVDVDMHDDRFGYKAPAGWSELHGGVKVTHEVRREV
jgi:hypothetical protein